MRKKIEPPPCPIDPVRMAWPFKTDKERAALGKWYAQMQRFEKKQKTKEILEMGKALI